MTKISKIKYALLSAMVLTNAVPQIAAAQSSDGSAAQLSGLYACQALTDKTAQLACFLAESQKLQAAETPVIENKVEEDAFEDAKVIAVPDRVEADLRDEIKAELKGEVEAEIKAEAKAEFEAKREAEEKAQNAAVRSLAIRKTTTYGANRYVRFFLENGEVWQQTRSAYIRLGRKSPDVLTISKAAMGSSLAKVNDKGTSFRIRRVK